MRIECQKCAAAYAIDDRQVTAKGIRAQCPRCRHLQLVKREPPPPTLSMRGATPPSEAEAGPPPSALDAMLSAPPPSRPAPAPELELELERRPSAASEPDGKPAVVACRDCGKSLRDAFEQSLGLCEGCRRPAAEPSEEEPKTVENRGPEETAAPASSGQLHTSSDRFVEQQRMAPLRVASGRSLGQKIGIAAMVLAVGVGGGVLIAKRPQGGASEDGKPATPAGAVEVAVAKWKLRLGALSGTAEPYLIAGEAKLALDTTSGYAQAELEFQKALVLDPSSSLAIAGYLRALALGRGERVDDPTFQEALGLVAAAEQRSGSSPRLLIAHAELLLSRHPIERATEARALAERALASGTPFEKALAQLVVGHSYLGSNLTWAAEAFEKALAIDPNLRRGYFYRAQVFATAGKYRQAIENLEARLALDPDQWEATDALARFYLEVGETERARATYQRALDAGAGKVRARISLAVLGYQHQGKLAGSVEALRALSQQRAPLETRDRLDALLHLVAAQRQLGRLAMAAQDLKEALTLAPEDPALHLQALLLALDRKEIDGAAGHLPFVRGRLGDPALEQVLEGRLHFAAGRFKEAGQALLRAHELDGRRTDALLLAGAAFARAKQETQAYEAMLRRAVVADPGRSAPKRVMTPWVVSAADVLQPALGQFARLSTGPDDPNPDLCEGLVRFHLKAYSEADRLLGRVVAIDGANVQAHSLRALIAFERNEKAVALKMAARALESDRQYPLAHYAYGLALTLVGKDEQATQELREALAQDPKLLGPRVKLAALLRTRSAEETQKLLLMVVGIDGTYPGAKRALYELDK